jgi:hypothetical protein
MATYPSGNTVSTENNLANIREKMVGAENFGDSIFTTHGLGRLRWFFCGSAEHRFPLPFQLPQGFGGSVENQRLEPAGAGIVLFDRVMIVL